MCLISPEGATTSVSRPAAPNHQRKRPGRHAVPHGLDHPGLRRVGGGLWDGLSSGDNPTLCPIPKFVVVNCVVYGVKNPSIHIKL